MTFASSLVALGAVVSCAEEPADSLEWGDGSAMRSVTVALPDPLPSTIVDEIDALLPESVDATAKEPQLFDNGLDINPVTEFDDTEVWVTFVKEGASYHNSLGYFTYPVGNPPSSLTDQQLEDGIIFADASGTGAGLAGGGTLENGARMYLGSFPKDVQIGFFLVQNGSCDTPGVGSCTAAGVNLGQPIYYTVDEMNPEHPIAADRAQHAVMARILNDPTPGARLLAFEDQDRRGSTDDDFNDVVFRVTASPDLGGDLPTFPANYPLDCVDILQNNPSAPDGEYTIDPDGQEGPIEPFGVYCDMTTDGGGWMRMMGAQWSHLFSGADWDDYNRTDPLADNYSILDLRDLFVDASGDYSLRLTVGNAGPWTTGARAHTTVWKQSHDPFTQSTDGSDYVYIAGDESTTCSGFNGLHNKQQTYSMTSDTDLDDSGSCWWMQIVPTAHYPGASGYLEGYGGTNNFHQWQALWIRADGIALEQCDNGVDDDGDGEVDEIELGDAPQCAASTCETLLDARPGLASASYWLDLGTGVPRRYYCDMETDGGGWMRVMGAQWSHLFSGSNWDDYNDSIPAADNYSILDQRSLFVDPSGDYTFRLTFGNDADWQTGARSHTTIWKQSHDPFTQSTDGSDYVYIAGDESTTCSGFNGLHNKMQGYSMTSDTDQDDSSSCWWMQIVPTAHYPGASGYLEGYGGIGNFHQWQALWVRTDDLALEQCDNGVDDDGDGEVDELELGGAPQCAASTCQDLLDARPGLASGSYWLDLGDGARRYYCDMETDGGGWTRVMGTRWPHVFSGSNWDRSFNRADPMTDNYSMLDRRSEFVDAQGRSTWRLTVGNSGHWDNTVPAHTTVWRQAHDAFTQTSNGADYEFIAGDQSVTCGGFNGLHNKAQNYSMTSDADQVDSSGCWWMQIVPTTHYAGAPGYLEGYGGHNYHQWQALWLR